MRTNTCGDFCEEPINYHSYCAQSPIYVRSESRRSGAQKKPTA